MAEKVMTAAGPMSDGDYALAFVNTTNSSAAYATAVAKLAAADDGGGGSGGGISLAPCNSTDPAQLWNISDNGGEAGRPLLRIASSVRTDGSVQHPPHCLEINGCNYNVGAHVDTSFGCKTLPVRTWHSTARED